MSFPVCWCLRLSINYWDNVKIENLTVFNNFIKGNGFTSLDSSLIQLNHCLEKHAVKCSCYKREDKIKSYNQCNELYYRIIATIIPKFKIAIFNKIGDRSIYFYDNNRLIGSISR